MVHNFQKQSIRAIACSLAILVASCAHPDAITAPLGDPSTFFATLQVRESAVTLALLSPYDTVQLHVAAQFADGSPVTDRVVFAASDSTVDVDSMGLVHARFRTMNLAVVRVAVTHAGLTRRDSVQIRVLAGPPSVFMSRLSITPPTGKSAVIPWMIPPIGAKTQQVGQQQLTVTALDALGQPVPESEIVIAVRSSDTTIAMVDQSGYVVARRPGHIVISATAVANGTFMTDSLVMTVGLSLYSVFNVASPTGIPIGPVWRLGGDTARIAAGGVVLWENDASQKIDLIFDDPANVDTASSTPGFGIGPAGGGNIIGLGLGTLTFNGDIFELIEAYRAARQARSFPTPGVYPFHAIIADSTLPNRIHGVVLVCAVDAVTCEP